MQLFNEVIKNWIPCFWRQTVLWDTIKLVQSYFSHSPFLIVIAVPANGRHLQTLLHLLQWFKTPTLVSTGYLLIWCPPGSLILPVSRTFTSRLQTPWKTLSFIHELLCWLELFIRPQAQNCLWCAMFSSNWSPLYHPSCPTLFTVKHLERAVFSLPSALLPHSFHKGLWRSFNG